MNEALKNRIEGLLCRAGIYVSQKTHHIWGAGDYPYEVLYTVLSTMPLILKVEEVLHNSPAGTSCWDTKTTDDSIHSVVFEEDGRAVQYRCGFIFVDGK